MRTRQWVVSAVFGALACAVGLGGTARAEVASDRAAAIVVFPKIIAESIEITEPDRRSVFSTDTLVQITNTSPDPVTLRCFYVSANNHCTGSGLVCDPDAARPCPEAGDFCIPSWVETDFRVILTGLQPVAWRASAGLAAEDLPLGGPFLPGGGDTNAGTRVPPVETEPFFSALAEEVSPPGSAVAAESFVGELKCMVMGENDRGAARNVIKGEATIVTSLASGDIDSELVIPGVEKYNAIGIPAIDGDANGDNHLELGGGTNEYQGCPNVLIVDHFFDFAGDPAAAGGVLPGKLSESIVSQLTLVSCTQDYRNQVPGGAVAQFLVFNEFEQRFSASAPMQCIYQRQLSRIDTRNPARSIFSAFVSGTLTGQTRIRAVGNGFVGILRERHGGALFGRFFTKSAAFNLHHQGERPGQDRFGLP